ncbi:Rrf2 family transcriptional regulator [Roseateles saccharophilus]|uniref:BadM/Rrf2 family transcriptional regulator n=1 Tax=Roseateles saccharophilus TaxID=304 RepID=A0A4R3VI64_ROSSA|nr:Rrf2 family transcriptional regulator [Roseateles saccharophilus]MDG0832021.1 Rrf2 family transcriptional regulator [Roseateles saccharophilus]TCV03429.1 BadM/Rrf2 family transcriptional regulator [Roseateles saccharophilus]
MLNFTLSSRACNAAAAMVSLEQHAQRSPASLPVLSKRMGISLSSLEQVIGPLRRNGLVLSTRGPGGGYQLGHAARDISVADIVAAVDKAPKSASGDAKVQGNWPTLSSAMARCLASVSLQDLIDDQAYESGPEPSDEAGHALRKGISTRPVLDPVMLPAHANTVFALAEALK